MKDIVTTTEVRELLISLADFYEEKKEELSSYDAVIGDGDHGMTLARGFAAGKEAIENIAAEDAGTYFKMFGRNLMGAMGGAIGPLFGSIFTELGKTCMGKKEIGLKEFTDGFEQALLKIMDLGGAVPGDKTMVDALEPAAAELKKSKEKGVSLLEGMKNAVTAAKRGMKETVSMEAKRGRSQYLREKSVGHQDAGATSTYFLFHKISDFIAGGNL